MNYGERNIIVSSLRVESTIELDLFREALDKLLYVPLEKIRSKIIDEIMEYFKNKQEWIENENFKFIYALSGDEIAGVVVAQNDPYYRSYSRRCGTWGWLHADSIEICSELMCEVDSFMRKHKLRRVRGPVNYPKTLGGVGIQVSGFEHGMMFGEAWGDPNTRLVEYLEKIGYTKESRYAQLYVPNKLWSPHKRLDKSVYIGYLTLDELIERKGEILDLVNRSFLSTMPLPDAAGPERLSEMLDIYTQVPNSFWKMKDYSAIKDLEFNPDNYRNIPEYKEAWEARDLEETVSILPIAFERKTGKIIGAVVVAPDLFQVWNGEPLTRFNADTSMVDMEFKGRGIYSVLANIGRVTGQMFSEKNVYVEGGQVWYNNPEAVRAFFPHCEVIKENYVMQKRVKS